MGCDHRPITTLFSGLGGYWLAGRNEDTRDQRAAEREAVARRAARAERLEEDRHTFQRDTLLALQDELQRLARITAQSWCHDEKSLKKRGHLYQLPEELDNEADQIDLSIRRLRDRILDSELRRAVDEFTAMCSRNTFIEVLDKEDAMAVLREEQVERVRAYAALSDHVGEHLRRELDRRILAADLPR